MLRKLMAVVISMSVFHQGWSQDSTKSLTLSGFTDMYYRYDLAKTRSNNLTSFTNSQNSFELGMASLKLDYKAGKAEMVVDLGAGKRAEEFSYTDEGVITAIKQAYISYALKDWLKLTAGSWATHVGYELLDANLNRNYSMSYMFTNGPFSHTGVKAEFSYKSNGFMVGVANPTDYKYVPDGYLNKKFLIAQYSYLGSDYFKAYVNYVGGQNVDTTRSSQFDLVLTGKLSNKFNLAYNGTYNLTKKYLGNKVFDPVKAWWGSAIYLNYDPSSWLGLTLREEYFNDDDQLKFYGALPEGGSVLSSTLSFNIKTEHLILIPELRLDKASSKIFTDSDTQPTKTAASVLVAAIFQF